MKNIFKIGFAALLSAFALSACDMTDSYSLGKIPSASELSFTASPTASKPNIVEFKNTSKAVGVTTWELGDGSTAKGETAAASYPYAGTYKITMTLYTEGGAVSVSQNITIANNDFSLLDTPWFNALTGGKTNPNGKTWVFDQYKTGHFGVGPAGETSPIWWACAPDGKAGCSLYSQEFTFTLDGLKMTWKNNGYVYAQEKGVVALGSPAGVIANPGGVGDFDVPYKTKASYTYSLNEATKTIKLSDDAFFGFYVGVSEFQVLALNENELYVKAVSKVDGNGWWFRLVPKDKNVKPVVPVKAVPLAEDFEAAVPSVTFGQELMGPLTTAGWSNPSPMGANTSKKVYLYQKSSEFFSNISTVATGYKFDLTTQNKIKLSVYIPSYNDYTTDYAKADWLTNTKLLKQVAVKLQNNDLGGNAWQTQKEIIKANLETDKWIDLEFDFSSVKDVKDYDKIVIQFGAEGHAGPGIFFFDNFQFTN